jgi:hypothetical protein
VIFESPYPDFGTLQVPHYTHIATAFTGGLAQHAGALPMLLRIPVRKIDASDIETGLYHLAQHFLVVGRRAQRRDDLCSS